MNEPNRKKIWKDEELKMLSEYVLDGKMNNYISEKLGRSVIAIRQKVMELGLPSENDRIFILKRADVARLVGDHPETVKRWEKKGLKFHKVGYYKCITEEKLIEWMKKNPSVWWASNCDYYFFMKYDFFLTELEKERSGKKKKVTCKKFSDQDIDRFYFLKSKGFTYAEIADDLGRGVGTISSLARTERKRTNEKGQRQKTLYKTRVVVPIE